MDTISLALEQREVTGKAVKRLRLEGITPAVIHDHGKPSINVQGQFVELTKVYQHAGKHHPVQLTAGGQKYTALIKHATFDPRKNTLTHVVFGAVKANEHVTAEIPVHVKYAEGNEASPAERAGLIVLHQLDTVEVEAIPTDLPDFLEFDGEKLVAVGDQATVADLHMPKGVTLKTEEGVLATVFEPSAIAAANDAAGGDEEAAETSEATDEASPEAEAAAADGKATPKE